MEHPNRKSPRIKNYDYSTPGAYFVTVCTKDKQQILSRIVGGDVLDAPQIELKYFGSVADKVIKQLDTFYDNISVDKYVIMPNHIHILLCVSDNGASRTSPPTAKQHNTVSRFVSTFKRFCNKEYGENIWQRSFHDHIIRGDDDYLKIWQYIDTNPEKWQDDCFYIPHEVNL